MNPHILLYPAHVPIDNINEFYNGILHPLMVPAHILAIVAVGLAASRRPEKTLVLSRVFMVALLTGLVLSGVGVRLSTMWILPAATLGAAMMVAANLRRFQPWATMGLLTVTGVTIGMDSTFDDLQGSGLWLCLLGCLAGGAFTAFYVALLAKKACRPWHHIAVRVVASWIVAVELLMVALGVTQG